MTRAGFMQVSLNMNYENIEIMVSKNSQRVSECVYCGERRPLSRDHIPPLNLFGKPCPSDLITVPSCQACNSRASLDDEYFRLAITPGIDPTKFPKEFDLSIQAIRKLGTGQKLGLAKTMLGSFAKKPLYTPAGLYLGEAGSLNVDAARIQRVLDRVVRGLFFHHLSKRLPNSRRVSVVSDWFFPVLPAEARAPVEAILDFLSTAEPIVIGSGVFCYRYRINEEEAYGSAWWLSFFEHRRFLCLTE